MNDPRRHYRLYSLTPSIPADPSDPPVAWDSRSLLSLALVKAPYRFVNTVLPSDKDKLNLFNGRPITTCKYDPTKLEFSEEDEVVEWLDAAKVWDCEWDYVLDSRGFTTRVVKNLYWYRHDGSRSSSNECKDIGYLIPPNRRVGQGELRRNNCISQLESDVKNAMIINHFILAQDMSESELEETLSTFAADYSGDLERFRKWNRPYFENSIRAVMDVGAGIGGSPGWLGDAMFDPARPFLVEGVPNPVKVSDGSGGEITLSIGEFIYETVRMQRMS